MEGRSEKMRSDRWVIGIFALVGAAVIGFLWLVNSDGPEAVVTTAVTPPVPRAGMDARLSATFFGRAGYTRSAPDTAAFDTELAFWHRGFPALMVLAGGLIGGLVGLWVLRWLDRPRVRRAAELAAASEQAGR